MKTRLFYLSILALLGMTFILLFLTYTKASGAELIELDYGETLIYTDMIGNQHTIHNLGGWPDPVNPDRWFCHGLHDGNGFYLGADATMPATEDRPQIQCFEYESTLFLTLAFGQTVSIPDLMYSIFLPVVTR